MRKQILSVAIALPMVMASTTSTFANEVVKVSQLTTVDAASPSVLSIEQQRQPQLRIELGAKRPKTPKTPPKSGYVLTPIQFGQKQPIRFGVPPTNFIEQPTRKRPPLRGDSVILPQQ